MREIAAALLLAAAPAAAEVRSAAPDGFVSVHSGVAPRTPDATWKALVDWGGWWPAAHSYSGKSENLSLDVEPDGELEEEWGGGAVLHGSVLQAITGKLLRIDGAFGPLQALPVNAILDIVLAPEAAGTRVTMTYRVGGPVSAGLDKLAGPVDGVMGEAFRALLAHEARPEEPEEADERAEQPEKPERPEQPERPERPEKPEKN